MKGSIMCITTVVGDTFTNLESVELARLILKRFGKIEDAHEAWCRLLQNSATLQDFEGLIFYAEHTPSCTGYCCAHYEDR